ncbi:hypothetical protein [uncultured Sulfitobacter sp.]|uniref:hypothetical protein n=1 Tax=uncultured Sulfitobacter sp. TaxID=191468 RepID=UPI00260DC537|nr:hypothetical protein [uncultured Sulfitobacter sp.]
MPEIPQPMINDVLAEPPVPDQYKKTNVPRGIIGEPLKNAVLMLDRAMLLLKGSPDKVTPMEGGIPGTVIANLPILGASVER